MTQRRFRILHVFRAPVGGLFRHVLDVTRAQAAAGHDVGIFCDSLTGGERAAAVLAELAPRLALGVTRVPMRRNPHPLDLSSLAALARTYRDLRPNVLHGHGSKGGAYARMVTARDLDPGTIRAYTPHGGSFNYKPGTLLHRLYMNVEGLLASRTDLFLFESEYIAGRFRTYVGATDRLVRVVANGIGDPEFEPIPTDGAEHDLIYLGEMRAAKGVDTLLDAMGLLRREAGRRVTLLAVGSGPDEEALRAQAAAVGVADAVTFEPPQPIRGVLGRGRLMTIPSRAESLPYVVLEAAAARQPLLATRVGGIPEIFVPFADELIQPNDPAILAKAIVAKLDEPEALRQAKAEALSGFVRSRFSLAGMVDGVMDGYETALMAREIAAGFVPAIAAE